MNEVDIDNASIFVSIAAYRDKDTRNTVNDLFAKAKNKNRIFVGILSQIDPQTDVECIVGERTNVREMIVNAKDSKGCGWARSEILTKIKKDEEFVLQIDAHTRFDTNWDITILEQYKMCPNKLCVISSYPPAFELGKALDTKEKYVYMKFRDFHVSGLPVFLADIGTNPKTVDKPRRTPALSAGCMFAPSKVFDIVPYDPHLYFFGEELSLAIRLYTNGINCYTPTRTFLYHLYYDANKDKKNLHWNDNKIIIDDNIKRTKYIIGMIDNCPAKESTDIEKYSVGKVRTIKDWENFAGVDLKTSKLTDMAKSGQYHTLSCNN